MKHFSIILFLSLSLLSCQKDKETEPAKDCKCNKVESFTELNILGKLSGKVWTVNLCSNVTYQMNWYDKRPVIGSCF